jgi:hypothetical protein|tara:strand:+ start:3338 stop:3547 length:210 start_codon:yes stop_codon:yes gene_type:complete
MKIEIGTKVKGVWGMMIASSFGEITEMSANEVTIGWFEDESLTKTWAQKKDIRPAGPVTSGSPIGIFLQ